MCLKCADLGHTMVDWDQHIDWSLRVVEEFYQQVVSRCYCLKIWRENTPIFISIGRS
jgi:hypothetical protein